MPITFLKYVFITGGIAALTLIAAQIVSAAGVSSNVDDVYGSEYGQVRHEYQIDTGKKIEKVLSVDFETAIDKMIVDLIKTTMPEQISDRYLKSVILTEDIDGEAFANVFDDEGSWEIVIDISAHEGDRKELQKKVIHEMGHVLSLNDNQLNPEYDSKCPTLALEEGCLNPNSYLYPFYNKFWNGQFKQDAFFSQYNKNPDAFTSEYAATNLAEDFADTFAEFVVEAKPEADTVAERKILSLYAYPEFIEVRQAYQSRY